MNIPSARVVFQDSDRDEALSRIDSVMRSGWLTLGPQSAELEREFAVHHEVAYAIAVSSGTSALEILLRCMDVAGSSVVVPANTFFATAGAVVHAGGRPVFSDVSPHDMMLTVEALDRAVRSDTKGVVLVHIGGMITPEALAIADYCASNGLFLLEDAAHAAGSRIAVRHAGSIGCAGAFSFYPTKIITAGEGGMITTNDPRIAEDARLYRDQGKVRPDENWHVRMGHNWRMSELHAAVGVVQLKRLRDFVRHKREIARFYDGALAGMPHLTPVREPIGSASNYHKYCARLSERIDRKALKSSLRDRHGVSLGGEVYDRPLHVQPVFRDFFAGALPFAEEVCARHICLPIHSDMTAEEARSVVSALHEELGRVT